MHILVYHQYYLMPGSSGGSRFNELARLWSEAGHQVTVIAGNLDYTSSERPQRYRGRWMVRENDGAVHVWRCHVPTTYNRSYLGRMWAFGAFTLSAATATFALKEEPDVIITTSPPLLIALLGWLSARVRWKKPWVFEVRDLWPESAVTTGVLSERGPLTKLLYWLEKEAYARADRICVLTPAFRGDIVGRGLASDEAIFMVPNGADIDLFEGVSPDDVRRARERWGWNDGQVVALYAGAHGRANALRQLVDTADRLRQRTDIVIACVGDGPERAALETEARDRGLSNIRFYGAQPKALMPAIVAASDIGVAVLQNNPTFRTVYPNKVFDSMIAKKPVVLGIDGVARQMVCDDAQAGVFAEPENPEALAAAIIRLADDPALRSRLGENGARWVRANASREQLAARYVEQLRSLVSESRAESGRS